MSVFLRRGVPEALKRRAFRALWRSDPVFGNLDRLNDYDEDFRAPSIAMKVFQSAWQAGRGYAFPEDSEPSTPPDADGAPDAPPAEIVDDPDLAIANGPVRPPEKRGEPEPASAPDEAIERPPAPVAEAEAALPPHADDGGEAPAVPSLRARLGLA